MTQPSLKELFKGRTVLVRYDAKASNARVPFSFGPVPGKSDTYQSFEADKIPHDYLDQLVTSDVQREVLKESGYQPPRFSTLRKARMFAKNYRDWILQLNVTTLLAPEYREHWGRISRNALTQLNDQIPEGIEAVATCAVKPLSLDDMHHGRQPELVFYTEGDGGPIRLFGRDAQPNGLRLEGGSPPIYCDSTDKIADLAEKGGLAQIPQGFLINHLGFTPEQFSDCLELNTYAKPTSETSTRERTEAIEDLQ